MCSSTVRVRFAPSPTGHLHIGSARTALFNWLFARHNNGKFILRIEDTDLERSKIEYLNSILLDLKWLGLDWDEGPDNGGDYGPYFQTQRLEIYKNYTDRLLKSECAYLCYCNSKELEEEREKARLQKTSIVYNGRCKNLTSEQLNAFSMEGRRPVVRFKVPHSQITIIRDLIKGEVSFDNNLIEDFIIIKSDGVPVYNFAAVVDDNLMKITHIIRGEEHLSNTPRQVMLYNALGFNLPVFAHIPIILDENKAKLSKRHGASNLEFFRENGILPSALFNFLSTLGWSTKENREILKKDELISEFKLENVNLSSAVFDIEKLAWMNSLYIREMSDDDYYKTALEFLKNNGFSLDLRTGKWWNDLLRLYKGRIKTFKQLTEDIAFYFTNEIHYDDIAIKKHLCEEVSFEYLNKFVENIPDITEFTNVELEKALRDLALGLEIKAAKIIHPLRVAVTGKMESPGIFDVIELLGRETTIKRIDALVKEKQKILAI